MNPVSRKAPAHPSAEAQRRLAYFYERRDAIVSTIRELVKIESPSDNKAAVDRMAEAVAQKFSQLGGKVDVRIHPVKDFGNHLQVEFPAKSAANPVLLLGHYDTVYPLGTLAAMPCRISGQQADWTGRPRYEIRHRPDAARARGLARLA